MNSQGNGPWDRGIIWPNIACQEFRVERVIRWWSCVRTHSGMHSRLPAHGIGIDIFDTKCLQGHGPRGRGMPVWWSGVIVYLGRCIKIIKCLHFEVKLAGNCSCLRVFDCDCDWCLRTFDTQLCQLVWLWSQGIPQPESVCQKLPTRPDQLCMLVH
jgi:hypothetical protein